MRTRRTTLVSLGLSLLAAMAAVPAKTQDYPARPVRILSDSAPGSAIDVIIRIVAERLTQMWGQQVVAVNQPGAGGSIATRAAAQSPPDGYTLFVAALSTFVSPPNAAANLPIQVPRDFLPVGYFGGAPMFVAAASWLEVKTLPDLIARAKKAPEELTYGTNGPGRLTHLTGELLASRAGIKLLMIPYSGGTAQVLTDMMGKRIPLVIEAYSGLAGAIQGGTIVPLAIASPKRLPSFPDVPTVAETLPGFEAGGWQVVLAPIGTPDAIVQKVNADLIKVLSDPDTRKRLARFHRDERPLSPAETAAFIQGEQKTWAPVLKQIAAGAK
jgi:tripartite-type tricarboxylate transporter receptor subunit TctC